MEFLIAKDIIMEQFMYANLSEQMSGDNMDFLSNGLKIEMRSKWKW